MNTQVGKLIRESIGEVEDIDAEEESAAWGKYLKTRIKLDISKPLLRGKKVNLGKLGTHWVWLSYKQLPNFCYTCSKLGHGHTECVHWKSNPESSLKKSMMFGPWMRIGDYMGKW